MSALSLEERIKLAVSFIEQSPPGQVNDVVNNIRVVIDDDDALMPLCVPALRAYNLAQLHVVEHAADGDVPAHSSLLSEATLVPNSSPERFYDHAANRTFAYDHVTLQASDYAPIELPAADASFRAALAASLDKYARNHFPSGHASVSTNQVPLAPRPSASAVPSSVHLATNVAGRTPDSPAAPGASGEAPTPANGMRLMKPEDEVDADGGLERLDEGLDGGLEKTEEESGDGEATPLERDMAGMVEEDPTPFDGTTPPRKAEDEVDADGGLERLDETLEEKVLDEAGADGNGEAVPLERNMAGMVEVEPTPADGTMPPRKAEDEVDADGGLEELDKEAAVAQKQIASGDGEAIREAKEAKVLAMEDAADQAETEAEGETGAATPVQSQAPQALDNPTFTLEIVGNRYNPSNFWTGRWRTRWVVDRAARKVDGTIKVDVHYYEQGNVQLATNHTASFELPSETDDVALASAIVTAIGRVETEYQLEIGDVYKTLGDRAFRALRRTLPVTRQRVDWDKVSGYSIGSDISKAFTA